jgi:photosystem II stability/assembly factor-like uncharacterized protein/sugar lactone lactonase YvrE
MKKLIFFLALLLILSSTGIISAQSGWIQQNSGTTKNLNDVFFIDQSNGFVAGDSVFLKTTNGGVNWINEGGTLHFTSVYFISPNTGYISTSEGYIFKYGIPGNWQTVYSNTYQIYNMHFKSIDTGFAVGAYGNYVKTVNGGLNWNFQNFGSNNILTSIYFSNSQTGFIVGYENPYMWGKVYRTTNGGLNWSYSYLSGSVVIYPTRITFKNNLTGFVVGSVTLNGFIAKTTDTGLSWNIQDTSEVDLLTDIIFTSDIVGYATGYNGTKLKTTNGGSNWFSEPTGINNILSSIYSSGSALYITGSNGLILKKDISVSARLNNVYRPNDGRTQFTIITLNDSLCTGPIDSTIWYVNDSLVSRQHSFTYPYRQGTTFVKLKVKSNHGTQDSTIAAITRLTYKKYTNGQIRTGNSLLGDSIFYAISTGDAVYRIDINGNTLYTLSAGVNVLSSCSIGYDTTVFFGSDYNLYGFNKNGNQLWSVISLGASITSTPTIDSAGNRLYLGISNGNFMAINKTSGGTPVWSYFCNAPVRNSAVISSNRKLVISSSVGTIYGFNLNLPNPSTPSWVLNLNDSILVSPAIDSSGYFYFGSQSGKLYKVALTGSSTTSIIWQIPLGSAITTSPVIDSKNNIYVGTAGGRLYSITAYGGTKWYFQTDSIIKSTPVITSNSRIYFGNNKGEIYGLDTAKNVKFYYIDSSKISCAMLYDKGTLYFGNEAGKLLAFYDTVEANRGPGIPVWGTFQNNPRRTGNQKDGGQSINIQKISEIIPSKYELYQNYPNPFNPITNIKFSIPSNVKSEKSNVKLIVYDILGREVATLVNEKQSPGVYCVDFDGTMFASGVYFYKIITGDFTEVKKMILLK